MAKPKQYRMYIGGEWVEGASGEYFDSYNPATGEPWCRVARGTAADVDRAVPGAP